MKYGPKLRSNCRAESWAKTARKRQQRIAVAQCACRAARSGAKRPSGGRAPSLILRAITFWATPRVASWSTTYQTAFKLFRIIDDMNEPQNRRIRTQLVLTGRCTPSRDLSAEHQDRITACHGRDIKRGCSRLLAIISVIPSDS